jgi:hypothetical protein
MWKVLFVVSTVIVLSVSYENQDRKIKIDWHNIWHFEEVTPKKVKLAKLPLSKLVRSHRRQGRIIGGTEIL